MSIKKTKSPDVEAKLQQLGLVLPPALKIPESMELPFNKRCEKVPKVPGLLA